MSVAKTSNHQKPDRYAFISLEFEKSGYYGKPAEGLQRKGGKQYSGLISVWYCGDISYEEFRKKLNNASVPTAVHYPMPLNKQPAVQDLKAVLRQGDKISDEVVSLPMHAYMTEAIFEQITNAILD